ncbi:MAG: hypothetical protein U0414_37490 [Polyangiaceae bacterium]
MIAAGALGIAVVLGAGLLYRFFASPEAPDERDPALSASAVASVAPPVVERCEALPASDFVIGDPPKAADTDADAGEEPLDAPFAAVLGRAIATPRGFAVPVLGDGENGSVMSVVELDPGGAGVTTRLSRSRGDLEPPVLFADGPKVLGAAIEPDASGLALKLFTIDGGHLTWGAELEQPKDESLATDVAASGERGIVVWDAVKDDTSRIVMASFKRSDVGTTTTPRVITDPSVDAEAPRLVPRTGGYFLLYRVRGAPLPETGGDSTPTKKKGSSSSGDDDEIDESRGEKGFASWVEALRLDENGSPQGDAEVLTPREGRVTGFDVTAASDAFALAWRDEDGPTGSVGGDVHVMRVTTAGPLPVSTLRERGEGGAAAFGSPAPPSAGVPILLGRWIAVPTLRGQSLLASLDGAGNPVERMKPEPAFAFGEPIAQRTVFDGPANAANPADVLLVAEPRGRAVSLHLLKCVPPR